MPLIKSKDSKLYTRKKYAEHLRNIKSNENKQTRKCKSAEIMTNYNTKSYKIEAAVKAPKKIKPLKVYSKDDTLKKNTENQVVDEKKNSKKEVEELDKMRKSTKNKTKEEEAKEVEELKKAIEKMEENCRIVVEDSRKYYQELEADLKLLTLELKDMKREKENFDSSIFKLSTKDILWQCGKVALATSVYLLGSYYFSPAMNPFM